MKELKEGSKEQGYADVYSEPIQISKMEFLNQNS